MVKKRKVGWGSYTMYVVLFLILLAVNGLIQFISAGFSWGVILTATYWLKTISGSASGLASFIIFSLLSRDVKISTNEKYNDDLDELNTTVDGNVGPDLGEFAELETRKMKKSSWILLKEQETNEILGNMNQRQLKMKRLIERDLPRPRGLVNKISYKRTLKKIRQVEDLDIQKTPEWIEDNIDYVKIKHPSITQQEIINGEKGFNNDTKLIDNNALGHIFKKRLPMIMLMTGLQMMYHSLIIYELGGSITMWLSLLFQLGTILFQALMGYRFGDELFRRLDRNNLLVRKNYLMKYLVWTKRPKEVIPQKTAHEKQSEHSFSYMVGVEGEAFNKDKQ